MPFETTRAPLPLSVKESPKATTLEKLGGARVDESLCAVGADTTASGRAESSVVTMRDEGTTMITTAMTSRGLVCSVFHKTR